MIEQDSSPQDILAKQKEFEAAQAEAARQKELKAQRLGQLQDQAGESYAERVDVLTKLEAVEAEKREIEALGIGDRLTQAEALRISQQEKQAVLDQGQADFVALREGYEELAEALEGKEMPVEVKQGLEAWQVRYESAAAERQQLTDQIGRLEADQVADAQVNQYRELEAQAVELKAKLCDLQLDPALAEILTNEAETETELKNQIYTTAIEGQRFTIEGREPERQDFVRQVTERFIDEEFRARGINQIKDPAEKLRQMQELCLNLKKGFVFKLGDDRLRGLLSQETTLAQEQIKTGNLLESLTSGDSMGSTFLYAEQINPKNPTRIIKDHLATLNFIRAYADGLRTNKFLARGAERMGQADQEISRFDDIRAVYNSPIIVESLSDAQKQQIKAEFEATRKKAEAIDLAISTRKATAQTERLAQIEQGIEALRTQLQEVQAAEKRIAALQDQELEGLQKKIADAASDKKDLEQKKQIAEQDLAAASGISIFYKRSLAGKIRNIEEMIVEKGVKAKRLEGQIEALQKDKELIQTTGGSRVIEAAIGRMGLEKEGL